MGRSTVLVVAPTAEPLPGFQATLFAHWEGKHFGVDYVRGAYDDPEQPRSGLAEDVAASWEEVLRGLLVLFDPGGVDAYTLERAWRDDAELQRVRDLAWREIERRDYCPAVVPAPLPPREPPRKPRVIFVQAHVTRLLTG